MNKRPALAAAVSAVALLTQAAWVASAQESPGPSDAVGDADAASRARLADFEGDDAGDRWTTVNDGVMGGRSEGGPTFKEGVMTFSGTINTNGGGFSSVRLAVEPGALADCKTLVLRVRGDGRAYRLTVEDDLGRPGRRANYGKDLEPGPAGEWRTVSVALDDLKPTFRGEPVDAEPLRRDRIIEVGLILNDGKDGPFTLDVDWIDAALTTESLRS